MPRSNGYAPLYWGVGATVVVADLATKTVAADRLLPAYLPRDVIGGAVRFTLVYNPGAAFGMHLGPQSRWIFSALAVGALVLLWQLFRSTRDGDWVRALALALVSGGAVGNLLDRLRSARGVVDFIDVGLGASRWPTFNLADMAVTCGAVLLALVLWREDAEPSPAEPIRGHDAPIQH
ncbi:MAG: signal peptidase II [Gemmatimonadetes bacterium]|nr:signal peptidase II [Gemmatimonadota bacterium]